MGSSANNPDGYTNTPCTHHNPKQSYCSKGDKQDYSGWCGCNSFNNQAIQCYGFAQKLGYDVFGTNPAFWSKISNLANVNPGDIIYYTQKSGTPHAIFVTAVSGDVITYADCNSDGHCKMRWNEKINKANIPGFDSIKHANNYDAVMGSQPNPSDTPTPTDAPIPSIENVEFTDINGNGFTLHFSVNNAAFRTICQGHNERY